jgi:hypothetical protein
MFEQTFVDGVGKTHKPWTVLLTFIVQTIAVIIMIIIPLLFTDALPEDAVDQFSGGASSPTSSATAPSRGCSGQSRESDSTAVRRR